MISPELHTCQLSDWSTPPVPFANSQNTQSTKKSNVSCKPLQWWSSLSPFTQGIFLGALTNCLVLGIVLPIWLTKSSAKTTTFAPIKTPSLRWNTTGVTIVGVTGVGSIASNNLQAPWGLVLDWSNTLYVTDRYNHRVQKFLMNAKNGTTVAGQMNGAFGSASNQLYQPTGIYLNSNGDIFVSDTNNNRIQWWINGATSGTTVVGNGTAGLDSNLLYFPYKIWRDESSGTLYVADSYNHRIMRYSNNAQSGIIIAGGTFQLSFPYGFYFDSLTNSLLIANAGSNNVVRWPIGASNWSLIAGDPSGASGSTATQFSGPTDITLDPMGNMYVVDMGNHRVQFLSSGQSTGVTIAGMTGLSGSNATLLNAPSTLTFDSQLNLYVVDQNNNRVQKFLRY